MLNFHNMQLHHAVFKGNKSAIEMMLQLGADPNANNEIGYARQCKHPEVIPLLKQAGAKE